MKGKGGFRDGSNGQRAKAAAAMPMKGARKGGLAPQLGGAPAPAPAPFKNGGKVENPHKARRDDNDKNDPAPRHFAAGGAAKTRKGAC